MSQHLEQIRVQNAEHALLCIEEVKYGLPGDGIMDRSAIAAA